MSATCRGPSPRSCGPDHPHRRHRPRLLQGEEQRDRHPLTGHAVYNVSPESAATYFLKIQCFCFTDQTIQPGVEATFPVIYYVDPKFDTDPTPSPLQELTLSYTFYPAPDVKPIPSPLAGAAADG